MSGGGIAPDEGGVGGKSPHTINATATKWRWQPIITTRLKWRALVMIVGGDKVQSTRHSNHSAHGICAEWLQGVSGAGDAPDEGGVGGKSPHIIFATATPWRWQPIKASRL